MKNQKKSISTDIRPEAKGGKPNTSPDTSKLQMIEIDEKTRIYISLTASAVAAKSRFYKYLRAKRIKL